MCGPYLAPSVMKRTGCTLHCTECGPDPDGWLSRNKPQDFMVYVKLNVHIDTECSVVCTSTVLVLLMAILGPLKSTGETTHHGKSRNCKSGAVMSVGGWWLVVGGVSDLPAWKSGAPPSVVPRFRIFCMFHVICGFRNLGNRHQTGRICLPLIQSPTSSIDGYIRFCVESKTSVCRNGARP